MAINKYYQREVQDICIIYSNDIRVYLCAKIDPNRFTSLEQELQNPPKTSQIKHTTAKNLRARELHWKKRQWVGFKASVYIESAPKGENEPELLNQC